MINNRQIISKYCQILNNNISCHNPYSQDFLKASLGPFEIQNPTNPTMQTENHQILDDQLCALFNTTSLGL